MLNPYIITTFLYFLVGILAAIDASLVSFSIVPWFSGIRWLRIHFITIGVFTQIVFAFMPSLVATRNNLPKPKFRWDIWGLLNVGFLTLLSGIPLVNKFLIISGGTLIFIAVMLLMWQLSQLRQKGKAENKEALLANAITRKFYNTGLGYFLFGIFVGTGLWFGWAEALNISVPLEVHIHANNWGLVSLVMAGLLIDLYPKISGRELANPKSVTTIYWMMTFGALGLVLGPWYESLYLTVPGLLLHVSATGWLLVNIITPLNKGEKGWTTGMLHIVLSYIWIMAPIMVAPLIILGVPGVPGPVVEANAPQALIYGWVLQFSFAIVPYLSQRALFPKQKARLGGNMISLIMVNLGGLFLWISIFASDATQIFNALAYASWAIAATSIGIELWQIVKKGVTQLETI